MFDLHKARRLEAMMARLAPRPKRNRVDQDGGLEMVRVFFLFFTGELSGKHAIAKAAQRHCFAPKSLICADHADLQP